MITFFSMFIVSRSSISVNADYHTTDGGTSMGKSVIFGMKKLLT